MKKWLNMRKLGLTVLGWLTVGVSDLSNILQLTCSESTRFGITLTLIGIPIFCNRPALNIALLE